MWTGFVADCHQEASMPDPTDKEERSDAGHSEAVVSTSQVQKLVADSMLPLQDWPCLTKEWSDGSMMRRQKKKISRSHLKEGQLS